MHMTLKDVLEKAIQKEIEAQRLYTDLSQKVKNSAATDALRKLSLQEKGHQTMLECYARGELKKGSLRPDHTVDYKIAEHLDQPQLAPDMELKDIFLFAARREKASHELYLSLAGMHPAGEVRTLLRDLAGQELEHKQKVESLYTEVAFLQTDGG
jgi:rubrerythrin